MKLHRRIDGPSTAPPLMLCNSLGATLEMWDPQVSGLTAQFRHKSPEEYEKERRHPQKPTTEYDDLWRLGGEDDGPQEIRPRRFPPEPIRSSGAMIANLAIRRRDVALDNGEDPNPFVDFVAKLPRRMGYNLGP